jgi:PAS domain S-box-containing protein
MICYEFLKEVYFQGHLSLWESHLITIIVTAIFSTLAAFLTIRIAKGLVRESKHAHLKLANINKNIFDAIILINDRGIIKTINPATEKMFGYSDNELVGSNIKILMPEPFSSEHDSYLHNFLTTRIPKIIGKTRREALGKRANGDVFPIDLVVSEMFSNGRIEFIGVIRDMTDYKRADIEMAALRQTEQKRLIDLQEEIEIAARVQINMLPMNFPLYPDIKEFDVFASMIPAKQVGGDFYDVFLINENTLFVAIGDVSGKGMSAALHMAQCMAHLRMLSLHESQPHKILRKLNNLLCDNNGYDMFITLCCGILNIQTGEFIYSNAGHNPPLTNATNGSFEFMPMPKSIVLGYMKDIKYKSLSVQLNSGDYVFLYTDGVTEAENLQRDLFSDERLLSTLWAVEDASAQKIIKQVSAEINRFSEGNEQSDDITMLSLHYLGSKHFDS